MKKINVILAAAVICFGMASCGEAEVDQAALDLKVQQRSAVRIEQINEEYAQNCEARMSTEVKAKTDSILLARQAATGAQ